MEWSPAMFPLRCSTDGLWPSWWPTLEPLRSTSPPSTDSRVQAPLATRSRHLKPAVVSMSRPLCCSRPQVLPAVGSSHRPGGHPVRGEGLRQGQPERSDEGRSSANAQPATSLLVCRRRGHRKVSRVHHFAQTIKTIHKIRSKLKRQT